MASGRMPCRTSSCRLRTRRGRVELGWIDALIGVVLASSSTEAEQARAGIPPSTTGYTAAKRCALAMIWSAARSVAVHAHGCALPASRSSPMCRGVPASSKAPNNPLLVKDDRDSGDDRWLGRNRQRGYRCFTALRRARYSDHCGNDMAHALSGAKADMTHKDDAQRRASLQ
jgi:hypothetical protein